MKVGLLADIHANADALSAVLASASREGIERLLVAGDIVGYYYAPDEVLAQLDAFAWDGIRGNHEDMLARWRAGQDREDISRKYGSGLAAACEVLDERALERLSALPMTRSLEIDGRRVLLCHGTPASNETYVYPDASRDAWEAMASPDHDLILYGHTHYPAQWNFDGGRIVNPGSVGQPRNRVPGAHWAMWDTATGEIARRVEAYDSRPLAELCRRRDPDLPYLADVLTRQ